MPCMTKHVISYSMHVISLHIRMLLAAMPYTFIIIQYRVEASNTMKKKFIHLTRLKYYITMIKAKILQNLHIARYFKVQIV